MIRFNGSLSVASLIECIGAMHLSSYVESPYKDRGGLMLVGPPGVLKTTMLDVLDSGYHNAICISNAFMQTMAKMQASFYNGSIRSMYFPDLQSIYAGDPRTAGRIEQMMMQLSGEATRTVSGAKDSRFARFKGYCTIFAAMTDGFCDKMENRWESIGFSRRFLWSTYTLKDPEVLIRAIIAWKRADLGVGKMPPIPINDYIPDTVKPEERRILHHWLKNQPPPHEIQLQVLCKMLSVLRWYYRQSKIKRDPMATLHDFAETLQKDAALLDFPEQDYDKERRVLLSEMQKTGDRRPPRKLRTRNRPARRSSNRKHRPVVLAPPPANNGDQHNDRPAQTAPVDVLGAPGNLPKVSGGQNKTANLPPRPGRPLSIPWRES